MQLVKRKRIWVGLIGIVLLLGSSRAVFANSSKITYYGPLWTDTSEGKVRVGHFEVDGQTAFCIEHAKESPPSGTEAAEKVYANEAIRKILYYGWEGPECWSGFRDKKQGITLTSLLLSEVHTTDHAVGTYNFVDGLVEFRNYVESNPAPDLDLHFDKSKVSAYYDSTLKAERTENITVLGQGSGKLSVSIPEDSILHNNTTGEDVRSGSAVLKVGESFYLRTIIGVSDRKSTIIKGKNSRLQPLVYVTSDSGLQDLSRLSMIEDVVETDKLTVDWIGYQDFKITKKDSETGETVAGATFILVDLTENSVVRRARAARITADDIRRMDGAIEVTTGEDGYGIIKEMLKMEHRYAVAEKSAPHGYVLSEEVIVFDVGENKGIYEFEMNNARQHAHLVIDKSGENPKIVEGRIVEGQIPLKGVKFELIAAEDILNWGGQSNLYNKDEVVTTITTDENGHAEATDLAPGKYRLKETKTAPGYILSDDSTVYDLSMDSDQKNYYYTTTLLNKRYKTQVDVDKYDKESGSKLEAAFFTITNVKGESIEVRTDANGEANLVNLPDGEYKFEESKAPAGYDVSDKVTSFEIDAAKPEARKVSLESYDEKLETPNSGDSENRLGLYILLLVLGIACLGFVEKLHK